MIVKLYKTHTAKVSPHCHERKPTLTLSKVSGLPTPADLPLPLFKPIILRTRLLTFPHVNTHTF